MENGVVRNGAIGGSPPNLFSTSFNAIPGSSPRSPSLSQNSSIISATVQMLRSHPAQLAKLFVGPGVAMGIALNFFALFALFNILNYLNLEKVKAPGQIDVYTKDSATYGGVASLLNGIMSMSFNEFVEKPYYQAFQTAFGGDNKSFGQKEFEEYQALLGRQYSQNTSEGGAIDGLNPLNQHELMNAMNRASRLANSLLEPNRTIGG